MLQLKKSQWVFFTSQSAVRETLKVADKKIKIAVIGEKTAEAVRECGRQPTFISSVETKRAMLSEWSERYQEPTTIFYPKSQLADNYLEDQLNEDHVVTSFISYENKFPAESSQKLVHLLRYKKIQGVYLTSPSAWRRFFSVYRFFDNELAIFVIGETTRRAVLSDGYASSLITNLRDHRFVNDLKRIVP
ncbi:hypothetical protein IGI39_001105 [Enterococcus sp. AZ135]